MLSKDGASPGLKVGLFPEVGGDEAPQPLDLPGPPALPPSVRTVPPPSVSSSLPILLNATIQGPALGTQGPPPSQVSNDTSPGLELRSCVICYPEQPLAK